MSALDKLVDKSGDWRIVGGLAINVLVLRTGKLQTPHTPKTEVQAVEAAQSRKSWFKM